MSGQSVSFEEETTLPVFVSPSELLFYTDDHTTHRQVLTIYNPYGYTLRYKVLCTVPRKYHVLESEGVIKSHCRTDIVVRHKEPSVAGSREKFQIQLFEHGSWTLRGHKFILSETVEGRPPSVPGGEVQGVPLQQLQPSRGSSPDSASRATGQQGQDGEHRMDPLVLCIAVVCGVALLLPTWQVDVSTLPPYLHLTLHQKLVVAYVLGLVTMVILHF